MRERTYWPELCVVQLAGEDEVAVVDALAPGIDLAPLGELLADPAVMKVFHAARQDVEIFLLRFGAVPTPIFDTQIAAMVAGFGDQVSYDELCRSLAGVRSTRRTASPTGRPGRCRPAQIAYAAADVTHLRKIYTALTERLEREGRIAWVAEEMAALADPATYRADPETAWERLKPAHPQPPLPRRAAGRRRLAGARGAARQHPPPAPGEGRDPAGDRRDRAGERGRAGPRPRHLGRLRPRQERHRPAGRHRSRQGPARGRPARGPEGAAPRPARLPRPGRAAEGAAGGAQRGAPRRAEAAGQHRRPRPPRHRVPRRTCPRCMAGGARSSARRRWR